MLDDLGQPVTTGGVTKNGLYRLPGMKILEGSGLWTIVKDLHVLVARGAFPGLEMGATIDVDGGTFTASEVLGIADPRFLKVGLRNT